MSSELKAELIEDKILRFDKFLRDITEEGMPHRYGTVWPVIIRKDREGKYEYEYPYPFFDNLKMQSKIMISYDEKIERRLFSKMVIDKHMEGAIDLCLYHFGMYVIYGQYRHISKMAEELTEKTIGKRRFAFIQALPKVRYSAAEDFIAQVWTYMIEKRDDMMDEYCKNPSMPNLRMLFEAEYFSTWTGTHYTEADWVEPIPGDLHMRCKTWTKEKDPMVKEPLPEGWTEGPIILDEVNYKDNRRHYVGRVALHAGSAIQVKFGKGWIEGRYEWDFEKDSPIRVHSGDEVIYIREGHIVRVR